MTWRSASLLIGILLVVVGTGIAAAKPPATLAVVLPGRWELRPIGSAGPVRTMCLADPAVLLQLRHPQQGCSHLVLDDDGHAVTVQYSCRGSGQGRTTLTVESPHLLSVATQGVDRGAPFDEQWEGRRTGACGR